MLNNLPYTRDLQDKMADPEAEYCAKGRGKHKFNEGG
jgi:hypothetical protein